VKGEGRDEMIILRKIPKGNIIGCINRLSNVSDDRMC
jgi:hypothetical protein